MSFPLAQVKRIQPNEELWAAVEEMNHDGVNQLPVVTDGHIKGMLRREDIVTMNTSTSKAANSVRAEAPPWMCPTS
jgi:predicted transcriptional regulator